MVGKRKNNNSNMNVNNNNNSNNYNNIDGMNQNSELDTKQDNGIIEQDYSDNNYDERLYKLEDSVMSIQDTLKQILLKLGNNKW
jgi:hypothetical protein